MSTVSHPSVGPDGSIYFSWDLGRLTAVNHDGSERWTIFQEVMYGGPMPSPTGNLLLAIGNQSFQQPGFIEGRDTEDGEVLWSQTIRDDEGADVSVYSRPRFAPDGDSAYFSALPQPSTPTTTFRLFAIDTTVSPTTTGDLDGDGVVNSDDLFELLGAWGPCGGGSCSADLNGDGVVNTDDLFELLGSWG